MDFSDKMLQSKKPITDIVNGRTIRHYAHRSGKSFNIIVEVDGEDALFGGIFERAKRVLLGPDRQTLYQPTKKLQPKAQWANLLEDRSVFGGEQGWGLYVSPIMQNHEAPYMLFEKVWEYDQGRNLFTISYVNIDGKILDQYQETPPSTVTLEDNLD